MNIHELQHILYSFSQMSRFKRSRDKNSAMRIEKRILSFLYFYNFDPIICNLIMRYIDEDEVLWMRRKYTDSFLN